MQQPNPDSKIRVEQSIESTQIIIPYPPGGAWRYAQIPVGILFLVALAAAWIDHLTSDNPIEVGVLEVVYMVFFMMGAVWMCYYLYHLLRPSIPETITLAATAMPYDSGRPAPQIKTAPYERMRAWKRYRAHRRIQFQAGSEQIATLKLREFGGSNRLTMDVGLQRIEIGEQLSDAEREWLHAALREHYHLD